MNNIGIILLGGFIICSQTAYCIDIPIQKQEQENIVKNLYGKDDLGENRAFGCGYINFGYWKNINYKDTKNLTESNRRRASEDLYKIVFENLDVQTQDKVLEIGCGRGYGAVYLIKHYPLYTLTAIDLTPDQIARARILHKSDLDKIPTLSFEVGSAHSIPKSDRSYTKIYSVEAMQHFHSIADFAKEAARLLQPNGKLVIAAHMPTSVESYQIVKSRIHVVANFEDRSTPITEVRKALKANGFREDKVQSIGKHVFEGSDAWRGKINDEAWTRDFVRLFREGHLDYYVLVYTKL
jgi:cyclopropane fatty-acyl-phospholipid synthase-like methyltransferase